MMKTESGRRDGFGDRNGMEEAQQPGPSSRPRHQTEDRLLRRSSSYEQDYLPIVLSP